MTSLLLIGKPNSGKSLLFNRLTGSHQRVANFPGVTTEVKEGSWNDFTLFDFPGSYSLDPLTEDEQVGVKKFKAAVEDKATAAVLCVLDATQLERSLVLGLQVREACRQSGKKIIFLLNMIDELESNNLVVDMEGLQQALQAPLIPISARTKKGLADLEFRVQELIAKPSLAMSELRDARALAAQFGPRGDVLIRRINSVDRVLLSSVFSGVIFLLVMLFLFQAIFTWSEPLMRGIEILIAFLGESISPLVPWRIPRDFLNDAVFGGVGAFVVFVPQIFILTLIIGLLEDSGYLARVVLICHRPLKFFGLSGKSFIPFLSGHACAIPAIYAARMIDSPKKRLITILALPLISCSARLPIYALLITALIPDENYGVLSLRGFVFFLLFLLGYVVALLVSGLYSKYLFKTKSDAPFIVELPPYRWPLFPPLLRRSLHSAWQFLRGAGPTIFLVTVFVWVLGYFPNGAGNLETSWMAWLGHFIDPLFSPLGLDWRFGAAILTSFLAREVFVGTLGTFYGIEGAEDNVTTLSQQLQAEHLSLASGAALLVFYVIALQCVSTLVVIAKETGSRRIAAGVFVFYTAIAYALSCLTYVLMR